VEIRLQLSWELGSRAFAIATCAWPHWRRIFHTKAAAAIDTGFKLELWSEEVRGRRSLAFETPPIG